MISCVGSVSVAQGDYSVYISSDKLLSCYPNIQPDPLEKYESINLF